MNTKPLKITAEKCFVCVHRKTTPLTNKCTTAGEKYPLLVYEHGSAATCSTAMKRKRRGGRWDTSDYS